MLFLRVLPSSNKGKEDADNLGNVLLYDFKKRRKKEYYHMVCLILFHGFFFIGLTFFLVL